MNAIAHASTDARAHVSGRICLTLPYPVSANRYWRPVSMGHRNVMVPTKEAKAYREEVAWRARLAGLTEPLTGRVLLTLRLYPHRPQDWQRRQRLDPETWDDDVRCIDLGNAEKVLSDALNGIAWVDDKQHRRIVKDRCEPDDQGARVEVEIEPLAPSAKPGLLP